MRCLVRLYRGFALWALILMGWTLTSYASAQPHQAQMPRLLVMGVTAPGTSVNAVGTGIAKLLDEHIDSKVRIRISNGLDALVGTGEVDFGISSSVDAHDAFNGIDRFAGHPSRNLRLVLPGAPALLGLIVHADSGLQTLADLKGRTLPGEFPNARPLHIDGTAMWHAIGMSWNDFRVIPIAGYRDNIQAFIEGRTDAAFVSVGGGLAQEADAQTGGIRFLSLPHDQDIAKKLWAAKPGFVPLKVREGYAIGIDRDIMLTSKTVYVTTNNALSAQAVYTLAKLLWTDIDQLRGVHPMFAEWDQKRMSDSHVTIPFHDGAIRLLKEVGAWTPAHEATQTRLLNPRKP